MSGPISQGDWAALRAASTAVLPELAEELGLTKLFISYQSRTAALMESGACPVLLVEKSRRIGLTWGLAAVAVLRAGRMKSAGGMDAMYISYSQEMTREFIDACAMWARAFAQVAFDTQEFLFEDASAANPADTRQIQAFRIRFASGFEIVALSSAPRTLRGKQGLVIIDEAAFVDSLKELLKAALAFLMWGGQVVICSTHNGAENEFNVQVQEILAGRSKFKHLKIDFDEALQEGLYQRICLVTGKEWSAKAEAEWRQGIIDFYGEGADEELFCIPSQGSGAFLTAPLIEARMTLSEEKAPVIHIALPGDYLQLSKLAQAQLFEPQFDKIKRAIDALDPEEAHALGYDPARRADPAVIGLLATTKILKRESRLIVEMRNVPFAEQLKIARHMMAHSPRLLGAAIDATGMGMNLAEDLGREFGLNEKGEGVGLVWPVMLNRSWYNEHFPPLKAAFEDDMIALARDANHLGDLRLVKMIRGVPGIPDEREGAAGAKRHGDFAVMLALAYCASRLRWVEYGYQPVSPPAQSGGRSFSERPDEFDGARGRDWWAPPMGAGLRGGI